MSLPVIKRLTRADIPDAPQWIESLLYPLNLFMSAVYSLLDRRLTFTENFRARVYETRIATSATYTSGDFLLFTFPHNFATRATGVLVLQVNETADSDVVLTGSHSVNWTERDGDIRVKYVSGLANSTQYNLRLLVV